MENKLPLVSVYTCVYNGERTLHRVFDSMKKLTYPNIEHVIVNDGSTDGTDELITSYIKEVDFPVTYHKKENGGKHTALNVVWEISKGDFLIQLDADDELLPESISCLVDTYYSIPEEIRENYWCVHGRCVTQNGDFVGDPYPEDINSADWREAARRAALCSGEKIGLQRREYMCSLRFPEVVGVSYIPEGILWSQLNRQYGTWYTNEVVRVYYVNEGGNLTDRRTKRSQFGPMAYYYKWRIMHPEWYACSMKNLLYYSLCFFVSTKKYRENNPYFEGIKKHKLLLGLLYVPMFFGSNLFRILRKIK